MREALTSTLFSLVFTVLALSSTAAAQESDPSLDNEARALFEAGAEAYNAARYDAALRYFEQSYELSRRPGLLYNIGASADRLQQSARALEAYRAYLEALPDANNRAAVQRRIAFLESLPADGGAADVEPSGPSEPGAPADRGGSGDVTGEWWFWTLIAALVVGAGVGITAGVVASSPQVETPLTGDVPVTMTLVRF
jgi:tetratricopeptide (TPR) repeat protein